MADAPAAEATRGYSLFYQGEAELSVELVAEGTDGILYLVPSEPGGWLKRRIHGGWVAKSLRAEELVPVSAKKARALLHYLYGDVGPVTIREAAKAGQAEKFQLRGYLAASALG